MNVKNCILCLTALVFTVTTNASAGLSSTISTGAFVDYAIQEDGTLLAWGIDDNGLLGENAVSYLNPVSLMENARFVEGVRYGALVIDSHNTLWGIGSNWFGLLALRDTTDITQPSVIMQNVSQVSAGDRYCLAVQTDGSLWGWGSNEYGQLGDTSSEITQHLPYPYVGPFKLMDNITSAVCHNGQSYALTEDGNLFAWGSFPTSPGGFETREPYVLMDEAMAIEDGGFLKKDHSLWAWVDQGMQAEGNQYVLEKVMDNVKQYSSDGNHFAAVKLDGSLWTWGTENSLGQLGNGSTTATSHPQKIMDNVSNIVCSGEHSLILTEDGRLWQTGYPFTVASALPDYDPAQFYSPYPLMEGIITQQTDFEPFISLVSPLLPCIQTLPLYVMNVVSGILQ